jgi:hypothetical protein
MTGSSHAGYRADIAGGAITTLFGSDPSRPRQVIASFAPFHSNGSTGFTYQSTTTSCAFGSGTTHENLSDFAWLPMKDIWDNEFNPSNAYRSGIVASGGHLTFNGSRTLDQNRDNLLRATFNATDNAAYRARSNPNLAAVVYVVGMSAPTGDSPDYTLLQRMANDPEPDSFNSPARYSACSVTPNCVTYTTQKRGEFIYATDTNNLAQVFLKLSSQILRLSH